MDKRCANALRSYNEEWLPGACQVNAQEETHECFKTCFGYDAANGGCFQHTFVKPILLKQGMTFLTVENKPSEWYARLGYGNQEEVVRLMTRTAYESDGQACLDCSMWADDTCMMLAWMQDSGEQNIIRLVKEREDKVESTKSSIDKQINNLSIAVELVKNYKEFMREQNSNKETIKENKISDFIKKVNTTSPFAPPVVAEAFTPFVISTAPEPIEDAACSECRCHYNADEDRYLREGDPHDCPCHDAISDDSEGDEG